jgi:uncharacterized protein (DUF2336 family)
MSASASLIPELEDVIQHGSYARRAETVRRIANLFIDGAQVFNEDHIGLFDDVLCRLVTEIENKARAEMSRTLSPIANAPGELMRQLANDDDIEVAGPVIAQSKRLEETDLVCIAQTKSQAHLFAISSRDGIGEAITDVLVKRGDPEVVRNVADNRSAKLSDGGFNALVKRAEDDGVLAEKVGLRADIPPHLFRELLVRATAVVQQRLLAAAKPETQLEVRRVLEKVSREFEAPARDYSAALKTVLAMQGAGKLDEQALNVFAADRKFEETVAALSGPDLDSLQGLELRLEHRARHHLVAARRQGFVEPLAGCGVHQLREARAGDGAACRALLAGARPGPSRGVNAPPLRHIRLNIR